MKNKKRDLFRESAVMNNATFMQYYERLTELAISMFEWKGLPDSVDPRFLELTLFLDGRAVFFKDEVMGALTLQCASGGKMNLYRIPKERRAYSVNGYHRKLNDKDSVLIYNNMLHTNSTMAINTFAKRLYNLDRAIDVNANAQKTPVLISCTEQERLTMLNLYKSWDGNEPFIFGHKDLNVKGIQCLKTDAPYVADKLYQLKTQIWNEALTYLGISNINTAKKERLITDEVTRNQGGVIASRYSRLVTRQNACKDINKMFGLDVSCEYRDDFRIIEEEIEIGGEEDV